MHYSEFFQNMLAEGNSQREQTTIQMLDCLKTPLVYHSSLVHPS